MQIWFSCRFLLVLDFYFCLDFLDVLNRCLLITYSSVVVITYLLFFQIKKNMLSNHVSDLSQFQPTAVLHQIIITDNMKANSTFPIKQCNNLIWCLRGRDT